MPAAHVREACGIPGTSVRTAYLCRDKPAMKEVLRAGGRAVRRIDRRLVARRGPRLRRRGRLPADPQAARRRRRVGDAPRVDDATSSADADAGHARFDGGASVAVEEFVEGHEGFYDTIADRRRGRPRVRVALLPERPRGDATPVDLAAVHRHEPGRRARAYDEVKEMGREVIELLGIGTSATHMEWFFGPKGLKFSEIGCRPPGVRRVGPLQRRQRHRPLPRVGDGDRARPSRRSGRRAASPRGSSRFRPDRDGRIAGYEGLDAVAAARSGEWIIDAHLPPPGHADAAGRGGLHGERLDAPASPRLRRAARDARRRRPDGAGAGAMTGIGSRGMRSLTLPGPSAAHPDPARGGGRGGVDPSAGQPPLAVVTVAGRSGRTTTPISPPCRWATPWTCGCTPGSPIFSSGGRHAEQPARRPDRHPRSQGAHPLLRRGAALRDEVRAAGDQGRPQPRAGHAAAHRREQVPAARHRRGGRRARRRVSRRRARNCSPIAASCSAASRPAPSPPISCG